MPGNAEDRPDAPAGDAAEPPGATSGAQSAEAEARSLAHDLNNMLSIILSYATVALQVMPGDSPARQDVEEIERAAERAGKLTRRLLHLARGAEAGPAPTASGTKGDTGSVAR